MRITMLKSKIHRATVTEANLNYVGSITIDKNLMDKSNILEYEKVQIVDIDNGSRFETYVIAGEKGSGVICLNGAAARMVQKGDKVIIMSYCNLSIDEAKNFNPTVLFVNKNNSISEITSYERHGEII
ncbi:aspartate 1-decarboxylase [Clostridium sp. FAM 1755]|uniref:aspartate 1-decarboxylase n=1 Tax=Clostridium TaxID=1485 RepID=UPI0006ABB6D1|nr:MULTISPECIES: aspartate 1-decarboxylase [Clostridium]KOR25723.1 aspartate decarboxylase [Clostridium sp. L74]NFV12999.1 aspartate 1-decarboxylase [Clostridium sporogenes]